MSCVLTPVTHATRFSSEETERPGAFPVSMEIKPEASFFPHPGSWMNFLLSEDFTEEPFETMTQHCKLQAGTQIGSVWEHMAEAHIQETPEKQ